MLPSPPLLASTSSVALVLAVVTLPFFPPEHVHRGGIEGRTRALAHTHSWSASDALEESQGLVLESSHGSHALAIFRSGDFTTASRFAAHPILIKGEAVIVTPVHEAGGLVLEVDSDRIHSPPRAVSLTRGPPALL